MPPRPLVAVSLLAACIGPAFAQTAATSVRYGRDVRPILSDRCYRCHGPDAQTREATLRLDDRDAAIAPRKHGAAIVPGDPESSLLWQRVRSHDSDERMPPTSSGKPPLSKDELRIIETWLRDGAPYEAHWAFVPPAATPVPAAAAKHPVDRFLTTTRSAHNLAASPVADRDTIVRRVFLVLTGLPPTPAERAAFLADTRADAYERLVDRLLGEEPYVSRHAEHLAGMWLDAGRYADTSGIHMDAGRQAWAWRDWLLEALRKDMPFDQFVVEQLAGDLLPDATTQQRVATGFLRNHVTTDEGGAIDEEYRIEYAAERTATVGSVFLGLTFGCARCHDHKYDPIKQEDYFRLFSFFNNNQEPGLYSQIADANRALEPFLTIPTAEQQERQQRMQQEIAAAEQKLNEVTPEEVAAFAAFRAELRLDDQMVWQRPKVLTATSKHGATLTVQNDGSVLASGVNPKQDEHQFTLRSEQKSLRWLALEALPDASLPHAKVGRAPNGNVVLQHLRLESRPAGDPTAPFRPVDLVYAFADVEQDDGDYVAHNLLADDKRGWAVGAHKANPRPARAALLAATDFAHPNGTEVRVTLRYNSVHERHVFGRVRLQLADGQEAVLARLPIAASAFHLAGPFGEASEDLYAVNHGPERTAAFTTEQTFGKIQWKLNAVRTDIGAYAGLPEGRNVHYVGQRLFAPTARQVTVHLGSDDGFQLFLDGAQVAERRVDRGVAVDQDEASVTLPAGYSSLVLKVINTGGVGGFAVRHAARAGELARDLQLLLLPEASRDADLVQRAASAFREVQSPHHKQRVAAIAKTKQDLAALEASVPRAMVMREAETERATYILMRGEYDKPDKSRPVARELPSMFGSLPEGAPKNRLGLARWLVSTENPLLLRVQVNRLWEFVFGQGLVRTSEDFGRQGEWPSHPELLDWLALEFRARGHSVRAMLRLLVTSDTFLQSSRKEVHAAAIDRDNRMLGWFPRRRLSAEAIRDQALFVSGLLIERAGGPSVKPLQPQGLWQEVAMPQSNTRNYTAGSGNDLRRRSLYTYWKRACPPPNLLTLDAPTREFCTIRRSTTNTPLQALVLWNDEHFVTAARALAQDVLANERGDDARIAQLLLRCTGHAPDAAAQAAAHRTLAQLRQRYTADATAATALAGSAASNQDPAAMADLAAFVVMANACLNLDATLCID